MIKVSDYIAQFFVEHGMKHIFSISGAGNVHLLKSIIDNGKLISIHPHQEQAGVIAALAYKRISNKLSVMITTSGGAATNAITGALDAWADSIPVLIISGQEKSEFVTKHNKLRMWGVQGFDICKTVSNITKYNSLILDPKKIRFELEKAVYLAEDGRPGPVWLDIPTDIQATQIDPASLESFIPEKKSNPINIFWDELSMLISKSERPVLILGNGVRLSRGESVVTEFLNHFEVPVLTAWNGIDLIQSNYKLYYGREGTYGQRCANFVVQNADLILTIGTRMAIPQIGYDLKEFGRDAKKIIVDIDRTELDKFSAEQSFFCIESDASDFMSEAMKKLKPIHENSIKNWITHCDSWRQKYPYVEPLHMHKEQDGKLNSYSFIDELNAHLSADEIIVTDMGTALTCTHQALKIKGNQRVVTSTGLGEMGFGLPGAIGASLASQNGRVVLINGDGSMMMNLQEMQTIRHLNLPIKLFVYINDGYLTIKHTQFNLFGNQYAGSGEKSGVSCPNFELIGKAFGFKTFKISSLQEAKENLSSILQEEGPILCEVFIHPMQLLAPKTSFNLNPDGTLVSPPLEDLFPFLDRNTFEKEMIIEMHPKSKAIKV